MRNRWSKDLGSLLWTSCQWVWVGFDLRFRRRLLLTHAIPAGKRSAHTLIVEITNYNFDLNILFSTPVKSIAYVLYSYSSHWVPRFPCHDIRFLLVHPVPLREEELNREVYSEKCSSAYEQHNNLNSHTTRRADLGVNVVNVNRLTFNLWGPISPFTPEFRGVFRLFI